jgi:hypothetical protein
MIQPPLISSQRYLNCDVIVRKAATFKVFVVRTLAMEIRGKPYRISWMATTTWQPPASSALSQVGKDRLQSSSGS